jgi:cathepsin H
MRKFDKKYETKEFVTRKTNILKRMHHVSKSDTKTSFGLTTVSDRTFQQNKYLGTPAPFKASLSPKLLNMYHLPESLDLRDKMQPVKDQGQCGSCYTFSAVSVLEYHAGVSISEQKIMDCSSSTNGPSYGCDGGWPENIFEYAKHSTVVLEKDEPYLAKNLPCNQTCEGSVIQVKRYGSVDNEKDNNSETRIPYILNTHGPVSVAIDVGTTELLMSYEDGIFPGVACGSEVDHAVTIVGYTPEYWIVRNSWSQEWGDDGYFYLERGVNACGVANYITYVSKT